MLTINPALIYLLPGLISIKDKRLEILSISHSVMNLVGWEHIEQAIGQSDYDMPCHAAEHAEIFRYQDNIAFTKEYKTVTLDWLSYKETWRLIFAERHIIKNADDQPVIYTTGMDVTDNPLFKNYLVYLHQTNGSPTLAANLLSDKKSKGISAFIGNDYPEYGLTTRQTEVLYYLLRGSTAKEIGQRLSLSMRTVEDHINLIKIALDCQTRSQLIDKAIGLGLMFNIPQSIFEHCLATQQLSVLL
jgi:DNA-binding CsgD family transcriptional regulator